ncbi:MAG: M15 family metallopeptidase [Winogradskyella sp.]|uniref:M15 family metallopeptidase n=1 Tax=Winogradskyella sp. TaxID=1883156 RepID=UPI001800FE79|nr:M15 family metallopeptidase [Winogradskyella sp.]MBT8243690.1 M15 family metallopeptidase [Winogradskyella sp.]NNK23975.1 M15 family metallopeptidase [Winogradskyella sp.]
MKFYKNTTILLVLLLIVSAMQKQQTVHKNFIKVTDVIPDLNVELRYFSNNNFIGDTVDGYKSNTLYLTKPTVKQLKFVQEELQKQNLCLKVYDGYRPQRAVNHFVRWARDINDTLKKSKFYPKVNKRHLFREGYIASKSGHSRGSTLDLTIVNGKTGEPLDMGSPYDFFGQESWVAYENITEEQKVNRMLLQTVMRKHGFRNYPKEWWHFTLRVEPFPNTYFDFEIVD